MCSRWDHPLVADRFRPRAALPYRNCIKYGMKTFCGPPAHQLRVLLQAIYTTGLRECRPGGYRNSPVAEELLSGRTRQLEPHPD
ncbi:hypothetical protein GCM10010376_57380 [Streptomyces violaceusniger]